jgi:aminoglycoside phosphotransferase (APT) family kinase protein
MPSGAQLSESITPLVDVPEIQRGDWLVLPSSDTVVEYLTAFLWDQTEPPVSWEIARLSRSAYVYRDTSTGWAVVVKFYAVKTGDAAERYADRELACTQRARAVGLARGRVRAVQPLAAWRGALFLEYVDGLTLEDVIAVRRSRPGTLASSVEGAASLLATLHTRGSQLDGSPDFRSAVGYAHRVVDELARWGVLENDPVVRDGLARSIDYWAAFPIMCEFTPTLIHGDPTTTNFVFPWKGGVVAVDWERLYAADAAADLGRLMAEVSHSVKQYGGNVAEAEALVQQLASAYGRALPSDQDISALLERARFYRASSTLRIARNGWVSRLDRMALVAQALALLQR